MTAETSLYVPADEKGMVALNREWLAARVVFAAGFVLAIGFFSWWTWGHHAGADLAGGGDTGAYTDADTSASQDQMDQAIASGQTTKEGFAMCRLVIGTAQAFGVLPGSMKYVNGPAKTDIRGRYVCAADDQAAAHYALTADLVCADLQKAQCVNLVTVQKADGTTLFKRQDNDNAPPEAPATPDQGTAATPLTGDTGTTDTSAGAPPADSGVTDTTGSSDGTQPPPQ